MNTFELELHLMNSDIATLTSRRDELLRAQHEAVAKINVTRPKGAERNRQVKEIMGRVLGAFEDLGGGHQKLGRGAPNIWLTAGRKTFHISYSPAICGDWHTLFFDVKRGPWQSLWKGRFGVDAGTLLGGRLHLERWLRPRGDDWETVFLQEFTTVSDRLITGPLPVSFLAPPS